MSEFIDGLTCSYTRMPDGSLDPNYADSYIMTSGETKLMVYENGILKLHKQIFGQIESVRLKPEGENMVITTNFGPIFLKKVKSIQLLR